MEGLIFGGAYVWRQICISKSIGLALFLDRNYCFSLFYFVLQDNFQVQAPGGGGGAYIWRGGLTEGFLRYEFGGLIFGIFGGAYFQNFTVFGDRG